MDRGGTALLYGVAAPGEAGGIGAVVLLELGLTLLMALCRRLVLLLHLAPRTDGAHVTVRRSKGREIAAACGQLRGKTERKLPQRRVDRTLGVEPADVERDAIHRERR